MVKPVHKISSALPPGLPLKLGQLVKLCPASSPPSPPLPATRPLLFITMVEPLANVPVVKAGELVLLLPIVTPAEILKVHVMGQPGFPARFHRFTFCDDVVIFITDGAT